MTLDQRVTLGCLAAVALILIAYRLGLAVGQARKDRP